MAPCDITMSLLRDGLHAGSGFTAAALGRCCSSSCWNNQLAAGLQHPVVNAVAAATLPRQQQDPAYSAAVLEG